MIPGSAPMRDRERIPAQREAITQPDGGRRMMALLDRREAHSYQAAVARLVPTVERGLGPQVIANRAIGRGSIAAVRLEPWLPARRTWRSRMARLKQAQRRHVVLVADVADCYASITIPAVIRALQAFCADPDDVQRLAGWLHRFQDDGVPGLPIGPPASAVLANAVLGSVDAGLRETGIEHIRWVDDIVVVANGSPAAARAHATIERSLEGVGLRVNPTKTGVVGSTGRGSTMAHRSLWAGSACDDAAP